MGLASVMAAMLAKAEEREMVPCSMTSNRQEAVCVSHQLPPGSLLGDLRHRHQGGGPGLYRLGRPQSDAQNAQDSCQAAAMVAEYPTATPVAGARTEATCDTGEEQTLARMSVTVTALEH